MNIPEEKEEIKNEEIILPTDPQDEVMCDSCQ